MTGKRTFAQGAHPSNDPTGEWEQIPILARDLERLEAIVGRPFADIDRVRVMALVNVVHSVRVINIACNVPAQDIKATLRAIGGLDASKVADALANADWYSKRLIEESLLWILACDLQDMRQVRPAAIRAAALLAAQDFKTGSGGSPGKRHRQQFAEECIDLWRELGRDDFAAWARDGAASPLVEFATALLALIESHDPPGFSTVSDLLGKVLR